MYILESVCTVASLCGSFLLFLNYKISSPAPSQERSPSPQNGKLPGAETARVCVLTTQVLSSLWIQILGLPLTFCKFGYTFKAYCHLFSSKCRCYLARMFSGQLVLLITWNWKSLLSFLNLPFLWGHHIQSLIFSLLLFCSFLFKCQDYKVCPGPLLTLMCSFSAIIIREQCAGDSRISNPAFSTQDFFLLLDL